MHALYAAVVQLLLNLLLGLAELCLGRTQAIKDVEIGCKRCQGTENGQLENGCQAIESVGLAEADVECNFRSPDPPGESPEAEIPKNILKSHIITR
jgi:hypothetical protein